MSTPITDEQIKALIAARDEWMESAKSENREVQRLRAVIGDRDATIAELRDRTFCEVEPDGESHDMSAGMICVKCWNRVCDAKHSLTAELAELRKPVAVEQDSEAAIICRFAKTSMERSSAEYSSREMVLLTRLYSLAGFYDALALRLADRVSMLSFVQDQLTNRNKENEDLKERERQLRECLGSLLAMPESQWLEPGARRTAFIAMRAALAQPQADEACEECGEPIPGRHHRAWVCYAQPQGEQPLCTCTLGSGCESQPGKRCCLKESGNG
jgi:hypothetical protein